MTRGFVRRLLAGIGLIAAGVLLLVLAYRPEMAPGVRLLQAGVFAACAFGGLAVLLIGWRGLIYGVCSGAGLAMMYANRALRQPLGGLLTIAGLLVAIGSPMVIAVPGRLRAFFVGRKTGRRGERNTAHGASHKQIKLRTAHMEEEPDALLLRNGLWISQYLREGDRIYIARVVAITDAKSERPLLRSAADYVPAKGSFILDVADIADVQRRWGADGEYIRIRRRDGRSMPWCELVSGDGAEADAQLAKVFAGIPVEWKAGKPQKRAADAGKRFFTGDKRAVYKCRKCTRAEDRHDRLRKGVLTVSFACQLVWLFVDIGYRVLCAANLILPLISFALYMYRLRGGIKGDKNARETRLMDAAVLPNLALGIRTLLDFNLNNLLQLLAPMGAIAILLALLARLITHESGAPRRWIAGALACMVLLYAPAASVQLNGWMDKGQNRIETVAPVVDMRVSRGGKSPTRYTLTLNAETGETRVEVTRDLYDSLQIGDEVRLITSTGPLGITYRYVNERAEAGS